MIDQRAGSAADQIESWLGLRYIVRTVTKSRLVLHSAD